MLINDATMVENWKKKQNEVCNLLILLFCKKIIFQKVEKLCFFHRKCHFQHTFFHYGELKNWEKKMKKIESSSTCIYYLTYFSSSLGGVSIGKTLTDYTTKFEATLYQCCVGTQFGGLEVPISIGKIWSKIRSDFWNWNLVRTQNCNQICVNKIK